MKLREGNVSQWEWVCLVPGSFQGVDMTGPRSVPGDGHAWYQAPPRDWGWAYKGAGIVYQRGDDMNTVL